MHYDIVDAASSGRSPAYHLPSVRFLAEIIEGKRLFSRGHEINDRVLEVVFDGDDRKDRTEDLFSHDRGVKRGIVEQSRLYEP